MSALARIRIRIEEAHTHRDDMVADLDVGDALADTLYDSASLVSEHHREVTFRVVTRQLSAPRNRERDQFKCFFRTAEEPTARRGRSQPRAMCGEPVHVQ